MAKYRIVGSEIVGHLCWAVERKDWYFPIWRQVARFALKSAAEIYVKTRNINNA
jgi:hypothetical protein